MRVQMTDFERANLGHRAAATVWASRQARLWCATGADRVTSGMLRIWYDERTFASYAEVRFSSAAWTGRA